MIRNFILLTVCIVNALFASLGSGLYVQTGVGFFGLTGDELYMVPSQDHFRTISRDSLFVYYKDFSESDPVIRPAMTIGWEQSFNKVLSVSSGLGLVFSGASWKANPVTNVKGETIRVPKIDASLKMTYLTLPVNAHVMIPLNSGGFVFTFGPRFALLCAAQFKNSARSVESDQHSLFRPLSIGLDGAFGGEIQLRKLDLLIALRANSGLVNESAGQSLNLRNSSILLETGFRWTVRRH